MKSQWKKYNPFKTLIELKKAGIELLKRNLDKNELQIVVMLKKIWWDIKHDSVTNPVNSVNGVKAKRKQESFQFILSNYFIKNEFSS